MDEHIEEFIYTKGKLTQEHYNIDLSHFRKWLRANTASVIQEDVTEIRLLHAQRYLKTLPDTVLVFVSLILRPVSLFGALVEQE